MNRSEQDRLLNSLLAGDELSGLRRSSLEQGLVFLRQRRKRRRVLRVCALACLPLALAAGLFVQHALVGTNSPAPRAKALETNKPTRLAQAHPPPVQLISDEQLLALFPGRPVALVGKPGHQQLVFLDGRTER